MGPSEAPADAAAAPVSRAAVMRHIAEESQSETVVSHFASVLQQIKNQKAIAGGPVAGPNQPEDALAISGLTALTSVEMGCFPLAMVLTSMGLDKLSLLYPPVITVYDLDVPNCSVSPELTQFANASTVAAVTAFEELIAKAAGVKPRGCVMPDVWIERITKGLMNDIATLFHTAAAGLQAGMATALKQGAAMKNLDKNKPNGQQQDPAAKRQRKDRKNGNGAGGAGRANAGGANGPQNNNPAPAAGAAAAP